MCEDAGDLRGEEHLESHRVVVLDVACSNPLSLEVSELEQVAVDCGVRCKVLCFLRRSSQLPSVAILPAWPNVGHPPLEHPSPPLLATLLSLDCGASSTPSSSFFFSPCFRPILFLLLLLFQDLALLLCGLFLLLPFEPKSLLDPCCNLWMLG